MVMLETLNKKIRSIDMADVKSRAKTLGSHAIVQAKSHAKNLGTHAKTGIKYVGTKRVMMAGRSVNPFLVGAAAVAIVGTAAYLILKRRNQKRLQFAGNTGMQEQYQPAK